MADLSFPLDKPLSSLEMKTRLLQFNEKLHAVRKWKDPQADKAIHLLVKDNIGVSGFLHLPEVMHSRIWSSQMLFAFKDCAGTPKSISSVKRISRN